MKIGIISDSHGNFNVVESIIQDHNDIHVWIHCGDLEDDPRKYECIEGKRMYIVRGNNDYYYDLPKQTILNLSNHRILITHSHRMYFDRREQLSYLAKDHDCDIVCYGHTHIADDGFVNGILLINPGSCQYPRDHRPPSYAILTIDRDILNVKHYFIE